MLFASLVPKRFEFVCMVSINIFYDSARRQIIRIAALIEGFRHLVTLHCFGLVATIFLLGHLAGIPKYLLAGQVKLLFLRTHFVETANFGSIQHIFRRLGSGYQGRCAAIGLSLILLVQLFNAVVLFRSSPVEIVLFSINHNHRMLHCASNLLLSGVPNRHVSNQIRNFTHLHLFVETCFRTSLRHSFICRISCLGIKALKIFQIFCSANFNALCRDDGNSVAIKVSARELCRNMGIDTYSSLGIAKKPSAFLIVIIDTQTRHLKRTGVRISYKNDLFAVIIVRSIDLIVLERANRQNDMCCLTGKSRCFQMNGSRITVISKRFKKFAFDRRICQCANLIKLLLLFFVCNIKLLFGKLRRLFGQKLRGQIL